MQRYVQVFCCASSIAQTQFEGDAALDDKGELSCSRGALEHAGGNHVGNPGADPSLRQVAGTGIGEYVLCQYARRGRRAGGWLVDNAHDFFLLSSSRLSCVA